MPAEIINHQHRRRKNIIQPFLHQNEMTEMNLQELLDKLSPEDRQLVIDHFVSSLLGLPQQKEIVLRRTATISTLGSEDEMMTEISQALNIPIDKLKGQDISRKLNELTVQHQKFSGLIKGYKEFLLNQKAREDKFEELYDLGKFLISINPSYHLELPEKISTIPDFIIKHEQQRVGVEHTRLINSETKNLIKTTTWILKKAEQILLAKNANLNQIINICINYSKITVEGKNLTTDKFSVKDKEAVAKIIVSLIEHLLVGHEASLPSFVENISISDKSVHPMSIKLNENYIAKDEFQQLFEKTIAAKETKYRSYSNNKSLDEIWLLIVASGVTAASSYLFKTDSFNKGVASQFDKVFLFDNFSHDYIVLSNNKAV